MEYSVKYFKCIKNMLVLYLGTSGWSFVWGSFVCWSNDPIFRFFLGPMFELKRLFVIPAKQIALRKVLREMVALSIEVILKTRLSPLSVGGECPKWS